MKRLLFALICLFVSPLFALADGFIVINPGPTPLPVPRGHFPFAPLEVTYHRVNVDITDQVAVTSVDEEFYNPNGRHVNYAGGFPQKLLDAVLLKTPADISFFESTFPLTQVRNLL